MEFFNSVRRLPVVFDVPSRSRTKMTKAYLGSSGWSGCSGLTSIRATLKLSRFEAKTLLSGSRTLLHVRMYPEKMCENWIRSFGHRCALSPLLRTAGSTTSIGPSVAWKEPERTHWLVEIPKKVLGAWIRIEESDREREGHTHTHVYIYTHIYSYICIIYCTYTFKQTYARKYMCLCADACAHAYMHFNTRTHTQIYIYTYIHSIYTYIYI